MVSCRIDFTPSNPFHIDYHPYTPISCTTAVHSDRLKVVMSDFNWLWRWDPNGWGDEPFYYSLNNFDQDVVDDVLPYNLDNKCLKLRVTSSESGFQYPDPPTPTTILQYPVTKFYEASTILTSQLDNCVWNAAPIQDERTFTYGWFEIRCKLPTAKYSWPGFCHFGGTGHDHFLFIFMIKIPGYENLV